MGANNSKFWVGLGVGSIMGAIVTCFSHTEKGKMWKKKMCDAVDKFTSQAECTEHCVRDKVVDAGTKAAEKVAEVTQNIANKADSLKDKVHSAAWDTKK